MRDKMGRGGGGVKGEFTYYAYARMLAHVTFTLARTLVCADMWERWRKDFIQLLSSAVHALHGPPVADTIPTR